MSGTHDDQNNVESDMHRIRQMVDQDLTEEQIDDLRKRLTESAERFLRLRAFPLANGDEPAPGFRPYKKEDRPS